MDQADDLLRYAVLFEDQWPVAKGNSAVTEQDVSDARELSARVLEHLSSVPPQEIAAHRDLRNRAGEYLIRGVEDIRDAARYVFRKDQDAMKRYPSLYTYIRSTKKTPEEVETTEEIAG